MPGIVRPAALPNARTFLGSYEASSERRLNRSQVRYWELMAAVRWAVIALQQGQRHCSGVQPSLELALTGRVVPQVEWDILMQIEALEQGGNTNA